MALALGLAGVVVAVLATVFAGVQAQLLRNQLVKADQVNVAMFYQTITRAFSEINRLFVERPELRPYFYDNKESSDPIEHQRLLAAAGFIVDLAESCVAAEYVLPGNLRGDWDDYFHFLYRYSPALREWWAAMGHLYPDEVRRAVLGPSLRPKKWPAETAPDRSGDAT